MVIICLNGKIFEYKYNANTLTECSNENNLQDKLGEFNGIYNASSNYIEKDKTDLLMIIWFILQ